jgi:tetraacyldisaccharide 4'-kinase
MPHPFDDHHDFQPEDFLFSEDRTVVMTSKDAVKCESFAKPDWWVLEVRAKIDPVLLVQIEQRARSLIAECKER